MTAGEYRELIEALAWGLGAGLLLMFAGGIDDVRRRRDRNSRGKS
ncbi:hypothetical protein ACIQPP_05335 [Streptomyces violaceusniger]|nr:hypothetical protein [Streptomyces hygroscopicus]AQW55244.1 glycosyl transferase [Streptomyces hygroscopicus]